MPAPERDNGSGGDRVRLASGPSEDSAALRDRTRTPLTPPLTAPTNQPFQMINEIVEKKWYSWG